MARELLDEASKPVAHRNAFAPPFGAQPSRALNPVVARQEFFDDFA